MDLAAKPANTDISERPHSHGVGFGLEEPEKRRYRGEKTPGRSVWHAVMELTPIERDDCWSPCGRRVAGAWLLTARRRWSRYRAAVED